MYLAENIGLLKKKWGFSNKKMGEIFRVNTHQVGSYSRGETEPNITFLILLEEKTGIPFWRLTTTMLKPEEIPAAPLTAEEFAGLSIARVESKPSNKNMREVSLEQLNDMQEKIDEVVAWMRAMQEREIKE